MNDILSLGSYCTCRPKRSNFERGFSVNVSSRLILFYYYKYAKINVQRSICVKLLIIVVELPLARLRALHISKQSTRFKRNK